MTRDALPLAVDPQLLLARLDRIASVLQADGHAMALIGLGSVGPDTARLDIHSDLDFFVIAEPGWKPHYLRSLDWLVAAHPLVWSFRNTADGHKALMADGVFCEFAVFEPDELAAIPYAPGRLVWARADADPAWAQPRHPRPARPAPDALWIVGEALSCLIVGLKRWHRGERLSAARFVQGHAVDRLLELDALLGGTSASMADPFNGERRIEARSPGLASELPALVPGYDRTPAAALVVLKALQRRGATLDAAVVSLVERLAHAPRADGGPASNRRRSAERARRSTRRQGLRGRRRGRQSRGCRGRRRCAEPRHVRSQNRHSRRSGNRHGR